MLQTLQILQELQIIATWRRIIATGVCATGVWPLPILGVLMGRDGTRPPETHSEHFLQWILREAIGAVQNMSEADVFCMERYKTCLRQTYFGGSGTKYV